MELETKTYKPFSQHNGFLEGSDSVVANVLDCDNIFGQIPLGKVWIPLFQSYGLNNITTDLLQGLL